MSDSIHPHIIDIEDIDQVPPELIGIVIPSPLLDVRGLLGFNTLSKKFLDQCYPIDSYIVQGPPPPLPKPELLRWLPVPTKSDVRVLSIRSFNNKSSIPAITIPDSGIVFPPTIIPFWEEVWKAHGSQRKWNGAVDWLRARIGTSLSHHLVERIVSSEWDGPEAETVCKLFSEKWLKGAQLNVLLSKLSVPPNHNLLVVMTEFIHLLKSDRNSGGDPNYVKPRALQTVEADVLNGKSWVLGILNISNVHWSAYAINVQDGEVKYGDPLGAKHRMPKEEEKAIWGWVHKLRLQMQLDPLPSQIVGWLPVNIQPDSHSCGLFAVNAIEAFMGSRSLVPGRVNDVDNYRIELAQRVIGSDLGNDADLPEHAVNPTAPIPYHLRTDSPSISITSTPVASTPTTPAVTVPSTPNISRSPTPSFSFDPPTRLPSEDDSDSDGEPHSIYTDSSSDFEDFIERTDLLVPPYNTVHATTPKTDARPAATPKAKITDWFQRCTPKEREEQLQKSRMKDIEAKEESQRLEHLRKLRADERQRTSNKEAQRRTRTRKRQREIEVGKRDVNGKRLKITASDKAEPLQVTKVPGNTAPAGPVEAKTTSTQPDTSPSQNPVETQSTEQSTPSPPEIDPLVSVVAIAAQDTRPASRKVLAALLKPPKKRKKVSGKARIPKVPIPQKQKRGPRYNWFNPLVWPIIDGTARKVQHPWSPTEIADKLKEDFPAIFRTFSHQRISDWRDHTVTHELVWKAEVLEKVKRHGVAKRGPHTSGVLSKSPEVVDEFRKRLEALRTASIPLDLNSIRGILIAILGKRVPAVFRTRVAPKGEFFRCSESFVRRLLRREFNWSLRKVTRAGQKIPADAEVLIENQFFRLALLIRDHDILDVFIVNSDQTQVVFSHGATRTWNESGAKQVSAVSAEEKRSFTLNVGIAMGGEALPFQAMFSGVTRRSLPSDSAEKYTEATEDLSFQFLPTGTDNHWSTQETMERYVRDILVPYFEEHKARLERPNQQCVWMIDVWSVHRSESFRNFMRENYPWITVLYVPGGCTGIFQPCDVGIQRVLKHAMRRTALAHVVKETEEELASGADPASIVLSKGIGVLRNRCVEWMVNGYNTINNSRLVKKAWELCKVGERNLSFESLTSPETLDALRKLRKEDLPRYLELSGEPVPVGADSEVVEDEGCEAGEVDTAVPLSDVVNQVLGDGGGAEDLGVEDDNEADCEGFGLMAGLDAEVDWSLAGSSFRSESATASWARWDA